MKKAILLLLTFSLSFIVNAQTVDEYVEYIQEQGKDPKEYIFEKFKEVDVIILGERSHRDTTQYNLIMDILKDPPICRRHRLCLYRGGSNQYDRSDQQTNRIANLLQLAFNTLHLGNAKKKYLENVGINWQTALSTTYRSTSINM